MTRTRKPVGRIAFVGAGPGDPGLLTRRAHDALVDADQVIYDRGVPESLLTVVRAEARDDAEFTPAEGATEHIGLDHLPHVSTFIADWVADTFAELKG